eukprot:TRINITY_DN3029_c0_g1_i4.p2 TRINITY_DN3029_c0_g1~~TRINITY_DN3029_c0_g1_i4.p2  ORF type:complete len:211 (+),score=103.32 TRINITY_DN3029_c0_g1_i4:660-1292(+)
MKEAEECDREAENQMFYISSESVFDEEVIKTNARACKVQICAQYFQFQARLAEIIKEQEKWKELAKKITEEVQLERKREEALKNKDREIVASTHEGVFSSLEALNREPQVAGIRKIDNAVTKIAGEVKQARVIEKVQAVVDVKKQRRKLEIKDAHQVHIGEILEKGTIIMKTAAETKDPKVGQLEKLKEKLGGYLQQLKQQRKVLKSFIN